MIKFILLTVLCSEPNDLSKCETKAIGDYDTKTKCEEVLKEYSNGMCVEINLKKVRVK